MINCLLDFSWKVVTTELPRLNQLFATQHARFQLVFLSIGLDD